MEHKRLIATLTALGLSLSGASHALLIWTPNGPKMEAQVVGDKLMVRDKAGRLVSASDGIYRTEDGRAIVVKGGLVETQDAKDKGQAVGPMYNTPASPNAPAAKVVKCPLAKARTEVVSKLPKGWWQTPYEGPLVATRVEMVGGEKTLVCEYQAYTTRASVMTKVPMSMDCVAVAEGFNCR